MHKKQGRAKRSRDARARMERNIRKVKETQGRKKTWEDRVVLSFHLLVMATLAAFFMWLVIQLLKFWGVVT